jgi:hypothetical protein
MPNVYYRIQNVFTEAFMRWFMLILWVVVLCVPTQAEAKLRIEGNTVISKKKPTLTMHVADSFEYFEQYTENFGDELMRQIGRSNVHVFVEVHDQKIKRMLMFSMDKIPAAYYFINNDNPDTIMDGYMDVEGIMFESQHVAHKVCENKRARFCKDIAEKGLDLEYAYMGKVSTHHPRDNIIFTVSYYEGIAELDLAAYEFVKSPEDKVGYHKEIDERFRQAITFESPE